MSNTVLSILLALLGIIATWLFAKLYFKKALPITKLSIKLNHSSKTIILNSELRDNLKVSYNGEFVEQLNQYQFVIANTGNQTLKGIIKPLILKIPKFAKVVNMDIPYRFEKDREVNLFIDENKSEITIEFSLLNQDEHFVLNLMIAIFNDVDFIANEDLQFTITAEGIPPVIKPEINSLIGIFSKSFIEPIFKVMNIFMQYVYFLVAFISIGSLILVLLLLKISELDTYLNLMNFKLYFSNFKFYNIIVLLGWIISFPLFVLSMIILFEILRNKYKTKNGIENKMKSIPDEILRKW